MAKTYRRSRWHYSLWYLLTFGFAALAIYLYDQGVDIWAYAFAGLFIALLITLELVIRRHVLTLEEHVVRMRHGLVTVRKKSVGYGEILDMSVHQTLPQRIFGYGTLEIDTGGTSEIEITMPYICHPYKIEEKIRKKVLEMRQAYGRGAQAPGTKHNI